MKNEFFTGMAALLLTFGLVLTGCPQDNGDDSGGNTPGTPGTPGTPDTSQIVVTSLAELEETLDAQTANTAAALYTVVLPAITISGTDNHTTSDWAKVNTAVKNAERYVILDLGKCTFPNNTVTGSPALIGMTVIKTNSYIKGIILPESVIEIGGYAFFQCSYLTSITIPAGVTSIGNYAFSATALTSVTIPSGVTSIGNYAFYYCAALTNVTIPASVTSIGVGAFTGCTALTSVTIQEGVTSIGQQAFYGCAALTSVTIPASVTSIGGSAFDGCAALTSVTFAEDSAIANANFGNYAFPEGTNGSGGNTLKTAYLAAATKAGTYTRSAGGSTWTKQGA
jgi:hypothetical protein